MKFTDSQLTELKTLYNIYKVMYSYNRICTLLSIKYNCDKEDIRRVTYDLYYEDIGKGFFV